MVLLKGLKDFYSTCKLLLGAAIVKKVFWPDHDGRPVFLHLLPWYVESKTSPKEKHRNTSDFSRELTTMHWKAVTMISNNDKKCIRIPGFVSN